MLRRFAAAAMLLSAASVSQAALITHVPGDRVPPVVVSPAFGALAAGGTVGANFIDFGVDYTWGGVEGIFDDFPLAFGGVNGGGVVDLVSPVDGRIVLPTTLTSALTNFVKLEAGFAGNGSLTLQVFDSGLNLLASAVNGPPTGPQGRTTVSISRPQYDIAFFRISGSDTFGVPTVWIEAPTGAQAVVPEPGTLALLGLGAAAMMRRRKRA